MADTGRQDGLVPRAFDPLPLGAVEPRGWLRRQLEIQAEGLSGHVEEVWDDLADNAWLGGQQDGWERGPYYVDGLVPLAHLLDDDELLERAQRWVEGFLDSQDEEGLIAADTVQERYDADDHWAQYVVCKVLRQHYEATGDERALDALREYGRYLLENPDDWSLITWAEMRWMDFAMELHWLHEETGEEWPLELVELLIGRGYDWTDHFANFRHQEKGLETDLETHVVNNAQGVKAPAVRYRQRGDDAARAAAHDAVRNLDLFHGQATGLFTGDEHLSGKHPSQGTELCAVVEYMYSLEYLTAALGDPAFGDRLERIAYNALPATFTPDMWAHQYDQQANQVICNVAEKDWTNGPDANIFGLQPNYGCCTANMHQGWPKFVSRLWMASDDGGLATVAYAPSAVTTTLDGEPVTVVAETDYPFEDRVTLRVDADAPAAFPLHLRVPEWAEEATVTLPGGETRGVEAGAYHAVEREWAPGDEVELAFGPTLEAERGNHGSVALRRGPLVFSCPVASRRELVRGEPPAGDWEYYPTEAWNYGLAVDADAPSGDLAVDAPGETPFDPGAPPVELTVEGRRVPEWELEDNWAGQIPHSPTRSDAPREELTLVPYGCTQLRVTEFPLLED